MLHLFKLFFWSVGVACIAWGVRFLFKDEERPLTGELLIRRIRESGF